MEQFLKDKATRVSTLLENLDGNFLELCHNLLKVAYPSHNLLGYAQDNNQPTSPATNDCYLVCENATIWDLSVEKNQVIFWNGTSWEVLPQRITQINAALQALWFDATNISCIPPQGMTATDVQSAIAELAAAVFGT